MPQKLSKFLNSFKTVLVVEDDDVLMNSISDTLREEGYKVSMATTGKETLPTAYATKPDLILLDLMLPEMDGMTILRELREASDWGRKVKVIIFSNLDGDVGLSAESERYGVSEYIQKNTVSLKEVISVVERALK